MDSSAPASATPGSTGSTGRKRGQKCTSDVWDDFDPIYNEVNGVKVKVKAKCHRCKSILSAAGSGGTGHLRRHRKSCIAKSERTARVQGASV
ncbi:hypothetical protein PR202_gb23890 [Eleusine coracana subsp. coracana]|uniref:BED-type domain-containing protein n=1 Tax=Eleusine coracana subsp. coracana TaxID=191504 RepID=A0AAV5FLJ6_ELECO|nr:hypothetical protein PR202_gb23890 [Eleusine coracana subsp. coracana]